MATTVEWFKELAMQSFQMPLYVSRRAVIESDVELMSDFFVRMGAASDAANMRFKKLDITQERNENGIAHFCPSRVVILLQNNIDLFRRIPAFSDVVGWYDDLMSYIAQHNDIEDAQWMTAQEKLMAGRVLWDKAQQDGLFSFGGRSGAY